MHQGKFKVRYPSKYLGDFNNIYYRSSWELALMVWCDTNPAVVRWSSEEVVIPYFCPTDNSWHRYFVDFYINFKNGESYFVELKPEKYTIPPEAPKSKNGQAKKRHINEVFTYVKNQAKWEAAKAFAESKNAQFQVWTEKTLKGLGIKLLK
jgi:hypothetical protein